jgi:hypothetical protein
MTIIRIFRNWQLILNFLIAHFQSFYDVKTKGVVSQSTVHLNAQLAIRVPTRNYHYCMRWGFNYKGFSKDGVQAYFSKKPPRLSL